jgi:hypothetical protein
MKEYLEQLKQIHLRIDGIHGELETMQMKLSDIGGKLAHLAAAMEAETADTGDTP